MWRILEICRWCIKYSPPFVKQTAKARKPLVRDKMTAIRKLVDPQKAVFGHLLKLGDGMGWHFRDGLAVSVGLSCQQAKLSGGNLKTGLHMPSSPTNKA